MTDNEKRLERARAYATEKHNGQFRIGGLPYITHPTEVAKIVKEKGYGIDYQICALFHDLLEDTNATEEEIEELGGKEVLEAVKLLTKHKGYVMKDYVDGIRNNPIAFVVKGADRLHNLLCAVVASEDFKRRYILESLDWYLDFDPEIGQAIRRLAKSMEVPIVKQSLLYEPIEKWIIDKK